eukprot:jgi/Chrzof1/1088/Cz01g39210.t1
MVMQDIQVATEAATSSVLMQVVAGQAAALSKQLAAELPPAHMWHIQGCRYLFLDQLCGATRASPLSKVSTLSSQSVSLAADLRRLCDQEAAIQAGSSAPPDQVSRSYSRSNSHAAASSRHVDSWAAGVNDGQGGDGDLEVVLRGGHDCWVVGRQTSAGRHLYVAYEGERGDGQNVEAITGKMQQLCDRHFTGAFDGL